MSRAGGSARCQIIGRKLVEGVMRISILAVVGAAAAAVACGGTAPTGWGNTGSSSSGGGSSGGSSSSSSGGGSGGSSGSFGGSSGGSSGGNNGTPLIYAHTDTELYSMDPTTHQLTDIGPFSDGTGQTPVITDLAVDANDDVWVNSETAIYRAAVPSGTGTVNITLQTQLQTSTKFYALGFTPAGVLGSGEALIAGDSAGDLYYIDTSGASATPQNLGGFGAAPTGGNFELSGDVVFYTLNGAPRGLATVRACKTSCSSTDDYLVEVDMAALQQAFQSKSQAGSLLKQIVGSTGTGYGRLFGIGAWGNSVYAFSRAASSGSPPAQLVQVGSTGSGSVLQQFANITGGWSGAGVTTKASVTVVQ
jgi:hypothetical protein